MRDITAILIGRLGDLIVATPLLRSLKQRYPGVRLKLVVSSLCRDAVGMIPFVDYYEVLHRVHHIGQNFMLCESLFRGPCDLALDLNPSFSRTSAALMAAVRKAPVKLGFEKKKWNKVFTETIPAPKDDEPMLARYARLAARLGAPYEPRTELSLRPKDFEQADMLLEGIAPGKRVLVHAGNFKKFDNRWPEEKFAALIDRMKEVEGVRPILLAGPGELEPVTAIAERSKGGVRVVSPPSLGASGALMKRMDLVVLNITGTTHLAAALGAPTFGLYAGYTNAVWHPPGDLHRGVVSKSWTSCRDISVEEAWAALAPLLKNGTK